MSSVRIVVIGGGGFLGGALLTALRERYGEGAEIRVVGRRAEAKVDGLYVAGDRNDPSLLLELAAWRPHLWFDLALFSPVDMEALLSHLEGLPGLQRVVVAGTVAEYGLHRRLPCPVAEEFQLEPEGTYGRDKAAAWELGANRLVHGLPLVWAVLPQLWGPGDPHGRDALYARRLVRGKELILRGNGRTLMPDGYVGTVAAALAHLGATKADAGRYNVCGARSVTPLNFIRRGAAALGRPATVLHVEPRLLGRLLQGDNTRFRPVFGDYDLVLDTTRLRQSGFKEEVAAAEGMSRTVQWHAARMTEVSPAFAMRESLVEMVTPHAVRRTYQ